MIGSSLAREKVLRKHRGEMGLNTEGAQGKSWKIDQVRKLQ